MIAITTPRCRICGGESPSQVDVPGGSLSLCDDCIAHLRNGRLDVKITDMADPDAGGGRSGMACSCAVLASYDGGKWNRVKYASVVGKADSRGRSKQRFTLAPNCAGPVSVDGRIFPSAQDAALSMRVQPQRLRDALKAGATEYAGHSIAYVKEAR